MILVNEQIERHLKVWQIHRPPLFRTVSDKDWFQINDMIWQMVTPDIITHIEGEINEINQ